MSTVNENEEPIDDIRPFQIQVAERMNGCRHICSRMNQMMYQKRAGDDVIDMGMGNPTDPPAEMSSRNWPRRPAILGTTATARHWHHEPAPRGGQPLSEKMGRAARSRKRSHYHARL